MEQRYGIKTTTTVSSDTEAFLQAVAGGLSEEFSDDISDNDLKNDVQRQELDE